MNSSILTLSEVASLFRGVAMFAIINKRKKMRIEFVGIVIVIAIVTFTPAHNLLPSGKNKSIQKSYRQNNTKFHHKSQSLLRRSYSHRVDIGDYNLKSTR
jgi:hypothetical protein